MEKVLYQADLYGFPILDVTRDLLFNVGGMSSVIHLILYLFILIPIFFLSLTLIRKRKIWKLGTLEKRSGNIVRRCFLLFKYVFLHKKILKELYPAIMHLCLFWGFTGYILTRIYAFVIIDIVSLFTSVKIFHGKVYLVWSLISDICGILVIFGIFLAVYRRYVLKPSRLSTKPTDTFAIVILSLMFITGYLDEAMRIALNNYPEFEIWSPVGYIVSQGYRLIPDSVIKIAHYINWWVHLCITFSIIGLMATGKLGHISIAFLNILKQNLDNEAAETKFKVKLISSEEYIEKFKKQEFFVTDFSSKQRMDLDACMRCGRCQDVCPAWIVDKKLSPQKLIQDLKLNMNENIADSYKPVINNYVTSQEIWACTMCGACQERCPVQIEHMQKIIDLRRSEAGFIIREKKSLSEVFDIIKRKIKFYKLFNPQKITTTVELNEELKKNNRKLPSTLVKKINEIEEDYNKIKINNKKKDIDWMLKIPGVSLARENIDTDYLYFAGCSVNSNRNSKNVAVAFLKILTSSGYTVSVLGDEEVCCGDSALRSGNEALYRKLSFHNLKLFNRYDSKKIVTTCPHGYNTIKKEYTSLAEDHYSLDFEVYHYTEILEKLLKLKKISFQNNTDDVITYHDPCMLGRYNEIYSAPRQILKLLPGVMYLEMGRNKDNSFCCGGGAAHNWIDSKNGAGFNEFRANEAYSSGATIVATACPYCKTMLTSGVKKIKSENLQVLDIAEIVYKAIQN